jgi:hypothetical protein
MFWTITDNNEVRIGPDIVYGFIDFTIRLSSFHDVFGEFELADIKEEIYKRIAPTPSSNPELTTKPPVPS